MAIQSNFITRHGAVLENAYIVIGAIDYRKFIDRNPDTDMKNCHALAYVFVNKAMRDNAEIPEIDRFILVFDVEINGEENYVAQAYNQLKAQEMFAQAEDV